MATVSMYLDTRHKSATGKQPLYYRVYLPGNRNFNIKTGLSVPAEWWDGYEVVRAPQREQMNRALRRGRTTVEEALLSIHLAHGLLGKTAEIKARILSTMNGTQYTKEEDEQQTFSAFYLQFMDRIIHSGTRGVYQLTYTRMQWFAEKTGHDNIWKFEEITIDWLKKFEYFLLTKHLDDSGKRMAGIRAMSTNSIAISMRNIRAVLNSAIDEELTTTYPFRKFKIKQEQTAKRSLSVEELRTLRDYPCEPHQERYRDLFMLIFYLLGINTIDLFLLTEVRNGRIEFRRSKTRGLFSIKVEPEAQAIIDKYRGEGQLLDVLDNYTNYKDFAHRMNNNLKQIGSVEKVANKAADPKHVKHNKKKITPLVPTLTTYWARHTWATVAADLDVPDETISLALGHSTGNRVTNIYINRNQKKVDDANRKVIDYLNGAGAFQGVLTTNKNTPRISPRRIDSF